MDLAGGPERVRLNTRRTWDSSSPTSIQLASMGMAVDASLTCVGQIAPGRPGNEALWASGA